nr:uncharacterized protein LOC117684462 isoform X2 [Crassostrea gigas]
MAAVTDKFYSNSWLYPDDHFAPGEHNLKFQLRDKIGIPWDFSKYDWERGCSVADAVLRMILNELRNQARLHFEGLEIHTDYIRQASARQGMKIIAPTEFDAVIPFTIKGLDLQEIRLRDFSDQYLPGQIRLRVVDVAQIDKFPGLRRAGVFGTKSGTCLIDTKALQEQVFKSLMDKAFHALSSIPYATNTYDVTRGSRPPTMDFGTCPIDTKALQEQGFKSLMDKAFYAQSSIPNAPTTYNVTRGSRPPTMDLKIKDDILEFIYVDFVPGFILDNEKISIPGAAVSSFEETPVVFPRYGLMKWINKENKNIDENDKTFIWRSCSSSYERFMFDLCVVSEERSYIRTACRVMKTLVHMLRGRQNQAANLLSSYQLNRRYVLHPSANRAYEADVTGLSP